MTRNLYMVLTENCDLTCRHCYLPGGPGKKHTTVSLGAFKSMVGNIPLFRFSLENQRLKQNTGDIDLLLTGGEVFTILEELYSFLDHLQEVNLQREGGGFSRIQPAVETNGNWARNDGVIHQNLGELAERDVCGIRISSNDKYHFSAGLPKQRIMRLRDLAGDYFKKVELRGSSKNYILPLGRAEGIEDLHLSAFCCRNFVEKGVSVLQDGSVYACCYNVVKLPGNLIDEPLISIVERAICDERLMALNRRGFLGVLRQDGFRGDVSQYLEQGFCNSCLSIYGESN